MLVQEKYEQLKNAEKAKKAMEKADPRLAKLKTTTTGAASGSSLAETTSDKISKEEDAIAGLQEKISILQDDMKSVRYGYDQSGCSDAGDPGFGTAGGEPGILLQDVAEPVGTGHASKMKSARKKARTSR